MGKEHTELDYYSGTRRSMFVVENSSPIIHHIRDFHLQEIWSKNESLRIEMTNQLSTT